MLPNVAALPATALRLDWLAERKKGIGGSDCAAVFGVGYGCPKRLYLDKRGEVPDFPREDNEAMRLGRVLEPFFAEQYERRTGRQVVIAPEPAVHARHPELRVNVDRMIMRDGDSEAGVLEIKSVGRATYYKIKREGLPEDYILQLQHAIEVTGVDWGAFCVGNRDSGEILYWDVVKDQALARTIVDAEVAFWGDIVSGNMPGRLEPDDRRCQKCEYRVSCQGHALIQIEERYGNTDIERDDSLAALLGEYLERKGLSDQAESLVEETKEELMTRLGDRQAVETAGRKVYFRPQVSMRGDFKTLAEMYEGLRRFVASIPDADPGEIARFEPSDKYKKPSSSRPLRVY